MANPKQKRSKSNTRTRRSTWKLRRVTLSMCPHCKRPRRPHYACSNCGYYDGREAVKQKPAPAAATAKS
ncbi:MAG: 50S ribosomal protein L32 [Candidatus Eremiobacteraeota bacterium]|nr:50S ribosomal protein L32 [Candidatus Eremiobacteraeota bacterium]MBV8203785.1 50S ribosomal protein L32 [Candidatus Eremiobacteraeota bacterium]MBV8264354.1 50S ribosomal protein L32 [Candidatus Eremiobacteraeota bacterium]MBV8338660.1 50S ribosomal protein L32 [Candidatus Eremiobacteraeota bacterium]MBV8459256.1 50S ribosomal protein L32 [Candidatus Eremiobacteraeota bacterium]